MKNFYCIGLGPQKIASAELIPYHKGWMITRIFVPDDYADQGHDVEILKQVMDDADAEATILYLSNHIGIDKTLMYWPYGFSTYKGVARRRPDLKGGTYEKSKHG